MQLVFGMADDVIDRLENITLTADEEVVIAISDDGCQEAIESCNSSLIGKFLTCKPYNKVAAKNTLRRSWGLDEGMQILEVRPNLFHIQFQSEFDMILILRGGSWSFDNQILMLQRWQKGMTLGNIKMENVSLWVQYGVPLSIWCLLK